MDCGSASPQRTSTKLTELNVGPSDVANILSLVHLLVRLACLRLALMPTVEEQIAKHRANIVCWCILRDDLCDMAEFPVDDHVGQRKADACFIAEDALEEFGMLHDGEVTRKYGCPAGLAPGGQDPILLPQVSTASSSGC